MEQWPYYLQLLLVLAPAAVVALVMTKMKLPALVGYLLVGILLGSLGFGIDGDIPHFLAEFGIMTLLFTAGLHIKPAEILKAGKAAVIVLLGQFLLLFVGGTGIGLWMGLPAVGAGILGICLWLSSTIVVLGVLERLGESREPHGQTMMAVMVMQDLVALLVIALLPTIANGGTASEVVLGILLTLAKATGIIALTLLSGKLIFPRIFPLVEDDYEQQLVWPIGWALLHMGFAHGIGFSPESAAFFAGISLSTLGYSYIVTDRVRSLTSFGLVFFFMQVGAGITFDSSLLSWPFAAMILVVIIGTPLINIPSALLAGFSRRAAFVTGLVPAQISEFSLVILTLAARVHLADSRVLGMVTAATAITMVISSLLASSTNALYQSMRHHGYFRFWEQYARKFGIEQMDDTPGRTQWDVVMYGADTDYLDIAQKLQKAGLSVIVLEPQKRRLRRLERYGLQGVKADYLDPDIVLSFVPNKILISTADRPYEADLWTIRKLSEHNGHAVTIAIKPSYIQAKHLEEAGWDMVINPDIEAAKRIWLELEKRLKDIYFS
ncbi:MAG TPA: cation:proton antiporter [bacterium]|nr:cation:proton antiporter [bacterium]